MRKGLSEVIMDELPAYLGEYKLRFTFFSFVVSVEGM